MTSCLFVTDLHGKRSRYEKLFEIIKQEIPKIIFLGGDILPNLFSKEWNDIDFLEDYLIARLTDLKNKMGDSYPKIVLILGNDDGRSIESTIFKYADLGIWEYIHNKSITLDGFLIYGYSFVPPSPFRLKDWEKYDVSRYVDPGCVSPEEGARTFEVSDYEKKYSTIKNDLDELIQEKDLNRTIILFHSPPYKTKLDRAALDGKKIDSAPLDVHVGSIAIQRFIKKRSPYLTLHGHIHESTRLTGSYIDKIENTIMLNAAHDGEELSIVRFQIEDLSTIERELI
ncbi:MAG: metallophosphoesterase [Candidatus Delongbacteria bacterium]|jgi:Icc-related predicted phosphoesterase|nr:metallophosphoesterase [Candidatus Delongbacteria bacterium]